MLQLPVSHGPTRANCGFPTLDTLRFQRIFCFCRCSWLLAIQYFITYTGIPTSFPFLHRISNTMIMVLPLVFLFFIQLGAGLPSAVASES